MRQQNEKTKSPRVPRQAKKSAVPSTAPEPEPEKKVFITMKTLIAEPPCKVVDLAAKGPVLLLRSRKAPGLLLTHEAGPDSITLVSLAGGGGFSLSRDAARALAGVLGDWAGPEEAHPTSTWTADEDRWELAK